ncbi:Crp/Fnr family transcriptional regulator [Hyphomicrobium sp. 1Nfss2.1]|uniref:Crp/Fnr family transcriptional regulator n=1 Tax=Hyphomicrobium sp. 1Nfss2.1 TaxID=3413936 RepID=UPI003C7C74F9
MLTIADHSISSCRAKSVDGDHRALTSGEILFREGEPRTHIYRVEKGAVCLFKHRPDGTRDVIEFAFPGDLVGLGYVDHHLSGAQATMDTMLTCTPRAIAEPEPVAAPVAVNGLSAAIEREVAFLNEAQRRATIAKPLGRIAALFVTLSRCNAYEGRDPAVLTDSVSCGVVAGYLNMSVDDLSHWLSELADRGLVEPCDRGLRLKNLHELESLAEAAD